jgi:hypothetical protein
MSPDNSPRIRALRMLLMMDATVLVLLGALFIFAPRQIEAAFHFRDLPAGVDYLVGLWGCCLATLGIGYGIAAFDPRRHVAWVQVGIARGSLEVVFGAICIARGVVTWPQASFGIIVAAFIAGAYLVLYPRKEAA